MQRRTFLKTAAAAAVGFQIVPRFVLGGDGSTPPSRRINLAVIGAGGQGGSDLDQMAGETIVALCDVADRRAADAFRKFPQAKRYKDFRKMLDEMDREIDAVLVGTPDHTHAVAAMTAMKHNKHVFCEKPLAHSVAELRALRKEARRRKLITQMGNQGHSTETIRLFVEWIQAGAIGNVKEVHAGSDAFRDTYCRINRKAAVQQERPPVPPELDWDLWQGPAAERPYHPDYLPWSWRGWMPYGGGTLGDWVCHVVDPSFWALDLDMPTSIQAQTWGYDPAQDADFYPSGTEVTFEFAAKGKRGPVKLVWYDGSRAIPRPAELEADRAVPGTGAVIIGDAGVIMHGSHGAGELRIIPETKMREYKRPEKTIPRIKEGHYKDWLNAIREGRQSNAAFEYGGRLSEIGLLGVIAIKLSGQKLVYNEKKMKFVGNPAANALLDPPYRKGWHL